MGMRVHALKFQSLALTNGLNRKSLWPGIEGRRHDAGMLKDSGLLNILEKVAYSPAGNVLSIYGDLAYPIRPHLTVPNRVGEVEMFTPYMPAFNEAMSSVRGSVEWLFGDVINSFKF